MSGVRRTPAGTGQDLLRTKLAPPRLHGALLPRPVLGARLDAGLTRKLTLVSAPVGWGKSTLVAGWPAARQQATSRSHPPAA